MTKLNCHKQEVIMDGMGAVGGVGMAAVAAPVAAPAVGGVASVGTGAEGGSVAPASDATSPSSVVSLGNGLQVSLFNKNGVDMYQAVASVDYLNGFVNGMMTDPYGTIEGFSYDELIAAFLLALLLKEKQ